jgi:hypothetical protein
MGNEDVRELQAQLEVILNEVGLALIPSALAAIADDKWIDDPKNSSAWRDVAAALSDLAMGCDL